MNGGISERSKSQNAACCASCILTQSHLCSMCFADRQWLTVLTQAQDVRCSIIRKGGATGLSPMQAATKAKESVPKLDLGGSSNEAKTA